MTDKKTDSSDDSDLGGYSLTLQDNAEDSLRESVRFYLERPDHYPKYCILLSFHSVTLFLKLRLARHSLSALFEDPQKCGPGDKTVGYRDLLSRLKGIGVIFTQQQLADLEWIRKLRNRFEHYEVTVAEDQLNEFLDRTKRFLIDFLELHLRIDMDDVLGGKTFLELKERLFDWQEQSRRTRDEVRRELGPFDKESRFTSGTECPGCNSDSVAYNGGKSKLTCLSCGESVYCYECESCGQTITYLHSEDDPDIRCASCWAAAAGE